MTSRIEQSLDAQLERMQRTRAARAARPVLKEEHVTLSHGSGGKASHNLIDALIVPTFDHPALDGYADSAVFSVDGNGGARLAFTTDSYVVSPLFFPGGDIGKL